MVRPVKWMTFYLWHGRRIFSSLKMWHKPLEANGAVKRLGPWGTPALLVFFRARTLAPSATQDSFQPKTKPLRSWCECFLNTEEKTNTTSIISATTVD